MVREDVDPLSFVLQRELFRREFQDFFFHREIVDTCDELARGGIGLIGLPHSYSVCSVHFNRLVVEILFT